MGPQNACKRTTSDRLDRGLAFRELCGDTGGFRQGTDNERSLALGGSAGSRVAVESASASTVREPDSCCSSRRRPPPNYPGCPSRARLNFCLSTKGSRRCRRTRAWPTPGLSSTAGVSACPPEAAPLRALQEPAHADGDFRPRSSDRGLGGLASRIGMPLTDCGLLTERGSRHISLRRRPRAPLRGRPRPPTAPPCPRAP
jgi:hypothetical protein